MAKAEAVGEEPEDNVIAKFALPGIAFKKYKTHYWISLSQSVNLWPVIEVTLVPSYCDLQGSLMQQQIHAPKPTQTSESPVQA